MPSAKGGLGLGKFKYQSLGKTALANEGPVFSQTYKPVGLLADRIIKLSVYFIDNVHFTIIYVIFVYCNFF